MSKQRPDQPTAERTMLSCAYCQTPTPMPMNRYETLRCKACGCLWSWWERACEVQAAELAEAKSERDALAAELAAAAASRDARERLWANLNRELFRTIGERDREADRADALAAELAACQARCERLRWVAVKADDVLGYEIDWDSPSSGEDAWYDLQGAFDLLEEGDLAAPAGER